MDTQDGHQVAFGGWRWNGVKWVPVPEAEPASGAGTDPATGTESGTGTDSATGADDTTRAGHTAEAERPAGAEPDDTPDRTARPRPDTGTHPDPGTHAGTGLGEEPTASAPRTTPPVPATTAEPEPEGESTTRLASLHRPTAPHRPAAPLRSAPPSVSGPPGVTPSTVVQPPHATPHSGSHPASGVPASGPAGRGADRSDGPPVVSGGPVFSSPPHPASAPPGPMPPAHVPYRAGVPSGVPHPASAQAYPGSGPGSGLTAADLRWTPDRPPYARRRWLVAAGIAAVVVLTATAATAGYVVRGAQHASGAGAAGREQPTTVERLEKGLTRNGFTCAPAFSEPVAVDLCHRDGAGYRDTIGIQKLDAERAAWVKVEVTSLDPGRHPVGRHALRLFHTVIDGTVVERRDAVGAKRWVSRNLRDDYRRDQYLKSESGAVAVQLLPKGKQSSLMWLGLTGAAYQKLGEQALPRITPEALIGHYGDRGFRCRTTPEVDVCERNGNSGTTMVLYRLNRSGVSLAGVRVTPNGDLGQAVEPLRSSASELLDLVLTGTALERARSWLDGAFDSRPHRTVVSGVEIRVTPRKIPAEAKVMYDVDVRPVRW